MILMMNIVEMILETVEMTLELVVEMKLEWILVYLLMKMALEILINFAQKLTAMSYNFDCSEVLSSPKSYTL